MDFLAHPKNTILPIESDTIASNRSRLVQISEGLYQHNGSGEYYARFWCKGKRIQQKLGTTESPCITLAEARRLVLVQRKKPDGSVRLSYCGGELLALMFADFSSGFQL